MAIVGLALGAAAPLISKSMKNSQVSNLQLQYLQKQIDDLKTKTLQSGSIVFFAGDCPTGWTDMSDSYAGRYVRIAGAYNICDKSGENTDGSCKNRLKTRTLSVGSLESESMRRIWGTFPGTDSDVSYYSVDNYVAKLKQYAVLGGVFDYIRSSDIKNGTAPYQFPTNWASLLWFDTAGNGQTFNTSQSYLQFIDPSLLTVLGGSFSAPMWFINSFDSARQVPTDTTNDELRPKTVVLKACKVPD